MLPPGHIAGGYLTAYTFLQLTHSNLAPEQTQTLLALGAIFGFAPDLDWFRAFVKVESFTIQGNKVSHRKFFSHAPLVWLAIGLCIFFLAHDEFTKYIGLIIWLGSWSHFVLDSIEYGVMWLWPFSNRLLGLKKLGADDNIQGPHFWRYWWNFLVHYSTETSFYLEIIVILIFIASFFRL